MCCLAILRRIFSVKFSADANFVLSGSDDTNIRIWKAEASKSLAKVRLAARLSSDACLLLSFVFETQLLIC